MHYICYILQYIQYVIVLYSRLHLEIYIILRKQTLNMLLYSLIFLHVWLTSIHHLKLAQRSCPLIIPNIQGRVD